MLQLPAVKADCLDKMFLGKVPSEQSEKLVMVELAVSGSDSFSFRLNNFSLMRSLDIHEDPTFIPEVAAEGGEDKTEAKNTLNIMEQLLDARSVCDVCEQKSKLLGTVM